MWFIGLKAASLCFTLAMILVVPEQHMSKNSGYENWDLHLHSERYDSVFSSDKIVYLSSEADTVLQTLEPETAYVIGRANIMTQQSGLFYLMTL